MFTCLVAAGGFDGLESLAKLNDRLKDIKISIKGLCCAGRVTFKL